MSIKRDSSSGSGSRFHKHTLLHILLLLLLSMSRASVGYPPVGHVQHESLCPISGWPAVATRTKWTIIVPSPMGTDFRCSKADTRFLVIAGWLWRRWGRNWKESKYWHIPAKSNGLYFYCWPSFVTGGGGSQKAKKERGNNSIWGMKLIDFRFIFQLARRRIWNWPGLASLAHCARGEWTSLSWWINY